MNAVVSDNPDERRYEIRVDGELAGFARYRARADRISFMHTEIDERWEGEGLGSTLVARALDDVRERGLRALPFCPFVNSYLRRHPEHVDLVPEDERERFGLAGE